MKIHTQSSGINLTEQVQKKEVKISKANEHSVHYANEKQIQKIEHQNIIGGYFKIFDESLTEVEIKNLISARLQPSYVLPQVHNTDALSLKAKELLDFSLSA